MKNQPLGLLSANDGSYSEIMSLAYCMWYCRDHKDYHYDALPVENAVAIRVTVTHRTIQEYKAKVPGIAEQG